MKKFRRIYIETTNICNLNCSFCPKTKRAKKAMTPEEFEIVASKVKPYTDYVCFHLMGEPLTNPHIGKFFEICSKYKLKVNLITNGTLVEGKIDTLRHAKSLNKITFSLHSFEANLSKIPLSIYIENCIKAAKSLSPKVIVEYRMWNLGEGKNELNDRIIAILKEAYPQSNQIESLSHNNIKLSTETYLNFENKFDWPDVDNDEDVKRGFCMGLTKQLGILSDGTVVPCCLDNEGTIALGNIFNSSIDEILKSKRAQDMLFAFSDNKRVEKLCRHCKFSR